MHWIRGGINYDEQVVPVPQPSALPCVFLDDFSHVSEYDWDRMCDDIISEYRLRCHTYLLEILHISLRFCGYLLGELLPGPLLWLSSHFAFLASLCYLSEIFASWHVTILQLPFWQMAHRWPWLSSPGGIERILGTYFCIATAFSKRGSKTWQNCKSIRNLFLCNAPHFQKKVARIDSLCRRIFGDCVRRCSCLCSPGGIARILGTYSWYTCSLTY